MVSNYQILKSLAALIREIESSERLDKDEQSDKLREIGRRFVDCSVSCSYAKECSLLCDVILEIIESNI